ncbi:amidohydrolase [Rhizobium anhuiense]|uniref:amidohydrolase n=1 Tax=Rhizobium anhuiense TaxID=1184720 RepID=UPI001442089F
MEELVRSVLPVVQDAYFYLHENPELGDEEHLASAYIEQRLRAFGYTEFFHSPSAPTAVISRIVGAEAGATIALRCELDARKLSTAVEPEGHEPRSKIDGTMHNCGHDMHTAILLGVAKALQLQRATLTGTVVLLFQPAEETVGGAPLIVADGILDTLGVKAVFAQHCEPDLPVGMAGIEPGTFLAGSAYFHLDLRGSGSHAAHPEDGSDMPVVASEVVRMLSAIPGRTFDIANRPVVISVTKLVCDSLALNVIAPEATIAGTVRSFENPFQEFEGKPSIDEIIRKRLDGLAASFGISYKFELKAGSPPCRNDEDLFTEVVSRLRKQWDGEVVTKTDRYMNSEDFAFYTEKYPCLYVSLGIAKDELGTGGCHTNDFTIHPDCMPFGISLMLELTHIGTRLLAVPRAARLKGRFSCVDC